MKKMKINNYLVLISIFIWGAIFCLLSLFNFNKFQLLNISGFLFLSIVPGLLTFFIFKLKEKSFWGALSIIVGLSLLELMLLALIGNSILPLLGIARPLDKIPLLFEIVFFTILLMSVFWWKIKNISIPTFKYLYFKNRFDFIFSIIPIIFVILSILGSIVLNNSGGNLLTMLMLGSLSIYLVFLIILSKKLSENAILTALFFISLSLLLMTSLRGWYITGHDIQSEFRVFQIARNAGIWKMSLYRDAYNACLSITILPTIFSNLLNISDLYIYKFLFQIFFALCTPIIYLIGRSWTNAKISLIGVLYFIGFPTYFRDMPFLIRQELAFLYFGLMLYIIFASQFKINTRRSLFLVMGVGVILSHYSTTYTILLIFSLMAIAKPIFIKIISKYKDLTIFKKSALTALLQNDKEAKSKITAGMIVALFVLSFFWTAVVTNTSGALTRVINETIYAVGHGFSENNKSIDIKTLLSFSKPDQIDEFEKYKKIVVEPLINKEPAGTFFNRDSYANYPLTVLGEETQELTVVGKSLKIIGINPQVTMEVFGQIFIKFIELLIPIGMIFFVFNNSIIKKIDIEIYLLSLFCLVFILANIVLPVLSTEYGIFRALQQSLFLIAPIVAVGSIVVGSVLMKIFRAKKDGQIFALILFILYFLYSSSFLRELIGGSTYVLHLNNKGIYYENYLIQTNEIYGTEWLSKATKNTTASLSGRTISIQTDKNSKEKLASLVSLGSENNIYPGLIRKNSYVFLGPTNSIKQKAVALYNADQISYSYPIKFLDDNKNLIYNNGGSRVYK